MSACRKASHRRGSEKPWSPCSGSPAQVWAAAKESAGCGYVTMTSGTWKLRQEDGEFEARLSNSLRAYLKK